MLYESFDDEDIEIQFLPMLPKIYDLMLPSLEARMNFINIGYRHVAFRRYTRSEDVSCTHRDIIFNKTKQLSSILAKLLNVNGILEQQESPIKD